MSFKRVKVCLFLGVVLALANFAFGQTIQSSMVGHVDDASGAAVPMAAVAITNEGTHITVQATTDARGTYSVSNLYAGNYQVEVRKEGFEKVTFTGIRVLAAQTVRQDAELKVGSVAQSVTVTSETTLVHTDSIGIAGEINTKQLSDLPLAQQSIDQLLQLVPGAQGYNVSNPQSGGAEYILGTNFTVNGSSTLDMGNGRGATAYAQGEVSMPPVSSMQEFKVNTANMNAEYRQEATVDMIYKQGTNKFHGTAYEYNQNTILTANAFTLNAVGKPEPPYNRNQFGANLGGPILKNKAFFFMNFSGFRQRQDSVVSLNFPTVAMRQGDFSALLCPPSVKAAVPTCSPVQLYNPLTGAAFSGNQIPTNMITTQAQTLDSYLPQLTVANSPGLPNETANFVEGVAFARDFDSYDARLDWQLTDRDNLSFYFTHNAANPWQATEGTPANYGNGENFGYKTIIYQLAETHIFNPSTTNDFHASFHMLPERRSGQDENFDPRTLFPQQVPSIARGLPSMSWTSYSGNIQDYGIEPWEQQPGVEFLENFTHVHGRHTLKAGADLTGTSYLKPSHGATLPGFNFTGVWTGNKGNPGQPGSIGNGFADYLLGDAINSSTSSAGIDDKYYNKEWDLYFQDTWQATPKLTIYYGMRYMDAMPWTVRDNLRSTYNFATNKIALPENSMTPTLPPIGANAAIYNAFQSYFTTTKALGLPINYTQNDTNNWGPRVGFAYRPFNDTRTVVRGGYGVFYSTVPVGEGITYDAESLPYENPVANTPAETFASTLPGTPTHQYLPDITFANPFPSTLGGQVAVSANPTLYWFQPNYVMGALQEWNLTVEHQLSRNDMVRVSYVGNQAHHIMWYNYDYNRPTVQNIALSQQKQRPYQPWATIFTVQDGGKQNMAQLQGEYIRHFAQGFSAQAEYQYTRALTNATAGGSPMIPAYPNDDYGNNLLVARHVFTFNYLYELPVGRGKAFLTNSNGVVDGILGGWEVAGITEFRTGLPFTVNFQVPSTYPGWWGGRADRVPGVNPYEKLGGHNITGGVQWFNPAAFAPPQPGKWGNSEPASLFGPGYQDWDMSAQKYFHVPIRGMESSRLQFRADFINAFNHLNLANPSATIADTRDGGAPVSTAGKVFGAYSQVGGTINRIIQLGLKLEF